MPLRAARYQRLKPFMTTARYHSSRRLVHSSKSKHALSVQSALPAPDILSPPAPELQRQQDVFPSLSKTAPSISPPLSRLPLSTVLRTYLITALSSSPTVLNLTLALLNRVVNSTSPILDVSKNLLLRWILKRTFYAQFAAGENRAEVQKTVATTKALGYDCVILEYAREVFTAGPDTAEKTKHNIKTWRDDMIDTIDICEPGDFVAVKWSGLGPAALALLRANKPPAPEMQAAIREVCDAAAARSIAVLPSAEESMTNPGFQSWTLSLQEQYNRVPKEAVLYTTYQCYLRDTPADLARDLAAAKRGGYTLGVKLVRGAYLSSESKSKLWSSKEETDVAYNSLMEAVLRKQYGGLLQPLHGSGGQAFPNVALMLATHNRESLQKAQAITKEQLASGEEPVPCTYGQLLGMADDLSCELIASNAEHKKASEKGSAVRARTSKCLNWGTLGQCLTFLVRRASENKDAAGRTNDARVAMGRELRRRMKADVRWN